MRTILAGSNGLGGFSFVELMTVLVLMTITASLVAPSMAGYIERTRTRRALDQVVSDVAYARLYAVQNARRTAINLQSDGTYTIDTLSTGGSWSPLRTIRLRDNYAGVSVSGAPTLEFSSRGLLTNHVQDVFLKVAGTGVRDSVFVSPAGRAYRAF